MYEAKMTYDNLEKIFSVIRGVALLSSDKPEISDEQKQEMLDTLETMTLMLLNGVDDENDEDQVLLNAAYEQFVNLDVNGHDDFETECGDDAFDILRNIKSWQDEF